jgi:hypothetical protein
MGKTTEELKAELAALEQKTTGAPIAQPTGVLTALVPTTAPTTRKFTDAESASLAEMKRMLAETIKDDPRPYLDAHTKCAVCLRHQSKQATKCELCGSEERWESVTESHPTWKLLGREHDSTKEHLSNLTTYGKKFEAAHIRSLMSWREGDGTRQINAATFVPTPYVLSFEQRRWCQQLLKWIEPEAITQEPEKDELDVAEDQQAILIPAEPETVREPLLSRDDMWRYTSWRIERIATNLPSAVSDWLATAK